MNFINVRMVFKRACHIFTLWTLQVWVFTIPEFLVFGTNKLFVGALGC